jgi:hypothetical protein
LTGIKRCLNSTLILNGTQFKGFACSCILEVKHALTCFPLSWSEVRWPIHDSFTANIEEKNMRIVAAGHVSRKFLRDIPSKLISDLLSSALAASQRFPFQSTGHNLSRPLDK